MKKFLLIVSGIICFLVLVVLIFLGYMGFFNKPGVIEKVSGPYTYVYEEFIGDYSKTFPVFQRVYKTLENYGIKSARGIGVYFDDPKKVPSTQLRSNCGAIIESDNLTKISELGKKLKVGNIVEHNCLISEFQEKNMLSYMIGPMKCYPAIAEYSKKNGYRSTGVVYEIYDDRQKKIFYIMEIGK